MILDDLVTVTKIRLARHQRQQSLADLKQTVAKMPRNHKPDFLTRLKQPGLHVIAEVKKPRHQRGQLSQIFPTWRSPKRTIKPVPMLSRS